MHLLTVPVISCTLFCFFLFSLIQCEPSRPLTAAVNAFNLQASRLPTPLGCAVWQGTLYLFPVPNVALLQCC